MTALLDAPLLDVRGLRKHYRVVKCGLMRMFGRRQTDSVRAVDDVSFVLPAGETLGLVGESGCGKTTTARSILDLVRADAGEIRLDGQDVRLVLAERPGRHARRAPAHAVRVPGSVPLAQSALDVNEALREPLRVHGRSTRRDWDGAHRRPAGDRGARAAHGVRYPHEFSGGQRQRVGIARALAVEPDWCCWTSRCRRSTSPCGRRS